MLSISSNAVDWKNVPQHEHYRCEPSIQHGGFPSVLAPWSLHSLYSLEEQHTRREHANVEYWGFARGEGKFDRELHENNTYKAIPIFGPGYKQYYSIWCNNEHELYNMNIDPKQLRNLLSPSADISTSSIIDLPRLVARLDTLLFVLKSCKGGVCREPWTSLHDVRTLADALTEKHDDLYETTQVDYDLCSNGYIVEAEGSMWETHGWLFYQGRLKWDAWT